MTISILKEKHDSNHLPHLETHEFNSSINKSAGFQDKMSQGKKASVCDEDLCMSPKISFSIIRILSKRVVWLKQCWITTPNEEVWLGKKPKIWLVWMSLAHLCGLVSLVRYWACVQSSQNRFMTWPSSWWFTYGLRWWFVSPLLLKPSWFRPCEWWE